MRKEEFIESIKPRNYIKKIDVKYDNALDLYNIITQNIIPDFTVTDKEEEVYINTIKYFCGMESDYDLRKGIYLYGKIGCGKTTFFKVFEQFTKTLGGNWFKKISSSNLVDGFSRSGFDYFDSLGIPSLNGGCVPGVVLLDDLGQSSSIVKHYGSTTNIVSEFIQRRYEAYSNRYVLTHITSNIEPAEFKEEYGEFISSRMREMFNVILYPGSDRRK